MYTLIGAAVGFVLWTGAVWFYAASSEAEKCEAAKYKSQVESLTASLEREKLASKLASIARDRLETNNAELENKLSEFESKLAPVAPSCIDRDAARRLRAQ